MKCSLVRFCHRRTCTALCAWAMVFACGSNAEQGEAKKSASAPKCCCLASFSDDIVAHEADVPMQPVAVPKYPEAALAEHWSARIVVEVSVDLAGKPKSMRIEELELSGGPKPASGTTVNEQPIRQAFETATIEAA
ncbi:hypothetical protein [Rudaea sp.]|uniref:hypothetical protein n=1 Tax=Rudaea sp. TaxID=2136325 RepID=UPI00321FE70E